MDGGRAAARRLDRRPAGRRPEQPAAGPALDRRDADGGGAHDRAGRPRRASPRFDHGNQALALRETDCYSGQRPYNLGLFHTGCTGGPEGQGERTIFGLNTAIQAVGEGNYGRLGPGQQQRYTDAEAEPMFGEPWTGGTPDEQPGRCPRSSRRRTSTGRARATPTSTAAGPAARCSCRPGATTAPPGRWFTSSSACGRTWAARRLEVDAAGAARPVARRGREHQARRTARSTWPRRDAGDAYRTTVARARGARGS